MKCPVCNYECKEPYGAFDDIPTEDRPEFFIIKNSEGWRKLVAACPKCKSLSLD